MATPVRYPSGVTNVKPGDACRNLPFPSFTRLHYFFDDFDWFQGIAASAAGPGTKWASVTQGDSLVILIDGDGGQIRLTAGSDDTEMALVYTQTETFTLEAGKRMWFGIRCSMGTMVTKGIFEFGIGEHDNDPLVVTDNDRIQFVKPEGATALNFKVIASSTPVAEALAIDVADGTMHTYEWEFDGVANFAYYIDGVHAGTISSTSFPTTEMGIYMACAPGSDQAAFATCPDLDVDWVYVAKERMTVND